MASLTAHPRHGAICELELQDREIADNGELEECNVWRSAGRDGQ